MNSCPDCNNEALIKFGQYIYYSNIFHINYCPVCGLYFSDTLLSHEVISNHFENTYNDESYFIDKRKNIFEHIAQLTDEHTIENGNILDIGGGKGHLLSMIQKTRADLMVNLNDLSEYSCKFCTETYGIQSFCCAMPDLHKINKCYETILLIDVIYYEQKLNDMFETINKLLISNQGTVIIRVPNKLRLIIIYQKLLNVFGSQKNIFFQSKVKYFNPEHIYIFSQPYLMNKLLKTGFNNIRFIPSPMLRKDQAIESFVGQLFFKAANAISRLTFGKLILTPSMIIIAKKSDG